MPTSLGHDAAEPGGGAPAAAQVHGRMPEAGGPAAQRRSDDRLSAQRCRPRRLQPPRRAIAGLVSRRAQALRRRAEMMARRRIGSLHALSHSIGGMEEAIKGLTKTVDDER